MLTRKTQYAWMSLGGLICLFGLVLACKLRDGNRAVAQVDQMASPPLKKGPSPSIFTLPPALQTKEPELLPPPKKSDKKAEKPGKEKPSEPKATLEMPMASDSSSVQISGPAPVLPTSYDHPNTPALPEPKNPKKQASPPPPASSLSPPSTVPAAQLRTFRMADRDYDTVGGPRPVEKKSETAIPSWNAPGNVVPASAAPANVHDSIKTQPGEPPLAPAPGPVQLYRARGKETLHDIARRTLGSSERWTDLHKLNPTLKPDERLRAGTTVRLPADACVQADETDPVKPLPILRNKPPAPKAKVLPLTGTYQCSFDEKGRLTLPRAIRNQLGGSDTVLVSPGPDKCLWLINQPHLERLGERLDQSQANEADVRVFKRLYFAQTEKLTVNGDGRVTIPERLGQFAGLHQEVVLIGIDDHFEVWDAARWRSYTQQKSAVHSTAMVEQE